MCLTLFGMVLAIGILVDDAIVVVENVERLMREEGLSPRDASIKAMEQITGALVGISLVLTAVFIPMAFFGGSVGAIYKQFSLSLVASMLFSIFLALTLTPALCAAILKPVDKTKHEEKKGFFGLFNKGFTTGRDKYHSMVGRMLQDHRPLVYCLCRDHRCRGFPVCPSAFIILAGRRPGLFYHQYPIARRSNPRADLDGAQESGEIFLKPAGNRQDHYGGGF